MIMGNPLTKGCLIRPKKKKKPEEWLISIGFPLFFFLSFSFLPKNGTRRKYGTGAHFLSLMPNIAVARLTKLIIWRDCLSPQNYEWEKKKDYSKRYAYGVFILFIQITPRKIILLWNLKLHNQWVSWMSDFTLLSFNRWSRIWSF